MIFISKYSGKADLFDSFGDYTDEQLQQCSFFIEDNPVPLRINNQHDLAPYYPHLITMGGSDNGIWNCKITRRSFVDIEEEEHLTWKLHDFQKYYRKCKRTKNPYIVEEALKKVLWFEPQDSDIKLAERVGLYGDKATIEGVHDLIHEHYRNEWLKEMIRLGWDEKKARYWIWKDWRELLDKDVKT